MEKKLHIDLSSINECLICKVCKGYLVDATTIPECLHTFCKSCLVKHLNLFTTCPDDSCKKVIHYSNPLKFIRSDRVLQELVYKLVPGLQDNELHREEEFYKARNIVNPSLSTGPGKDKTSKETVTTKLVVSGKQSFVVGNSEIVGLELIPLKDDGLEGRVGFRYIRCPAYTTITKLKKLIALKLYQSIDKQGLIDILFNEEILGKDHTLKFVIVTRFKSKSGPLQLHYREICLEEE